MAEVTAPVAKGLLVKVRAGPGGRAMAMRALGAFEPILEVPARPTAGMGMAASEPAMWVRAPAGDNPWDHAHALIAGGFAADGSGVLAAEPDLEQSWGEQPATAACDHPPQTNAGGRAMGPHDGWHLDDAYSGLRTARGSVGAAAQGQVIVAHLDTGYDPDHLARPAHILTAQERNFTREGDANSARDVTPAGGMRNQGHGTGTIGILAGGDPGGAASHVAGPIGGAPEVRILPIRIADSVTRFTTGSMVQGFAHARACGVDVLSMSMGGLASAALADAVNLCYEDGIVLVTAAGNFLHLVPSPRSTVYPARMRRVLAATGVMADGQAYFGHGMTAMQGCHGPDSKMATSIAGWTPNIPWAEFGCGAGVRFNGEGTSAATPQVAAAAALWIAKYKARLAGYPQRWMKGEAVRRALLDAAHKTTAALDQAAVTEMLGAGAIDARAALAIAPLAANRLVQAPPASASLAWLKLLTGRGVGVTAEIASPREQMLELEILQIMADPAIERIVPDPEAGDPGGRLRRRFLEQVRERGSQVLRAAIDGALGVRTAGPPRLPTLPPAPPRPPAAPPSAAAAARRPKPPGERRLRIFALDPSLGGSLDLVDAKVATVNVRFETDANGDSLLRPGPVGDYLEVVDVDPASDQFYPPVDLDDPRLLLQDGLAPSEGNPQFHQQMVYAVAMRTIASFEGALGRDVLWAPHARPDGRYEYVHRLRLYPHAMRARNAYYSPNLSAVLFGYFPADSQLRDTTAPGTLVFGCLSADIVAHEMTHALLDGYTPGFRDDSNPDVGAFHEAFADVVALFQHFQYKDLVRREIARARGNLSADTLLGGIGRQFGEGINKHGPLRDYHAGESDVSYRETFEVHDRGSLLVRAIYQAFLAIFARRTGDLIRLATGGSGVLGVGAIHPDLVERLTDEACKAAGHVLRMCIRALDYMAPVDVTFGAYLRALITADLGQVDDDRFGYRTALIEAFRRRDLLPEKLRTVSVETLAWAPPIDPTPPWLARIVTEFKFDWELTLPRALIYQRSRARCRTLHRLLRRAMTRDPDLCAALGLEPGLPRFNADGTARPLQAGRVTNFEVRNVRGARRQRPDGTISTEIIVVLAQRRPEPMDGQDIANGFFWYAGGTTLVIDPSNPRNEPEIKYLIWKRLGDRDRLDRERDYRGYPPSQDLRALYLGDRGIAGAEPFAALHATEY